MNVHEEKSTISSAVLDQIGKLSDYLFRLFLEGDISKGTFNVKVLGYATIVSQMESIMHPILAQDAEYKYELQQQGLMNIEPPTDGDYKKCYEFILKINKKIEILSKRFSRLGLMPQVPTSLSMITRTQKYEKFKRRIGAQAIKYIDLHGEELLEFVRKRRLERDTVVNPEGFSEAEYAKAYMVFLAKKGLQQEELDDDGDNFAED